MIRCHLNAQMEALKIWDLDMQLRNHNKNFSKNFNLTIQFLRVLAMYSKFPPPEGVTCACSARSPKWELNCAF